MVSVCCIFSLLKNKEKYGIMKAKLQKKSKGRQIMMRPKLLKQAFSFTIGGADGPTSVFLAGKIGGLEIFLGICSVVAVILTLVAFYFIKKHHR